MSRLDKHKRMGKLVQMKVMFKHEKTKPVMRVTAKIPIFLALCLFSAQTIAVQHSHNGDLAHDLDCSICVKQNSECDYLFTEGHESKNIVFRTNKKNLTFELISTALITAKSRSPPLA